ncbi:uncharacterized protein SCHCODRAFT_02667308 [Schizophyllum commune H4-8]|nr:uncharacterized protein SCHCODRAFT_02667308 [Schizophyllum commune H4-8]KAI5894274.1 hypothetical protein SCHCODRAFT_02667308 [Schizophyllum commune H4-8]
MDVYSSSKRLELDTGTLSVLDAFLDRRTLEHLALSASSIPSQDLVAILERPSSLANLSIEEEYFTDLFWRTDPASDPVYV